MKNTSIPILLRKIMLILTFLALSMTSSANIPSVMALNSVEDRTTFLPYILKDQCNLPYMGAKYLFLDSSDLPRIKAEINSDWQAQLGWTHLKEDVDQFMDNFPTAYDPYDGWGIVWQGTGRYYPRDLALVYLITENPFYADGMVRLLRLIVSNSDNGPGSEGGKGGLFIATSHLAVTYQSLLFMYLVIRDTNWLNDQERTAYDDFFKQQVRTLLKFTYPFNPSEASPQFAVNYPLTADVAGASLALPFIADAEMRSIFDYLHQNIEQRISYWFDQDGGWGEYADSYSAIVQEELMLYFEALYRSGCNLYPTNYNGKTMQTMCEWFIKDMLPEGSWPAINDGVWLSVDMGYLELCSARTGNAKLTFGAERAINGYLHLFNRGWRGLYSMFNTVAWAGMASSAVPPYVSTLLENTGLAMLRSGWETDSSYLSLQYTDSRRHQHYSYGNINLHDRGAWIVDNAYQLNGGYEGEEHVRSRRTDEHSTLTLDDSNQMFTGGDALIFEDLTNSAMMSVQSQVYMEMSHTRSVLWAKPWHQWIVIDEAALSGNDHTLQLNWFTHTDPGEAYGNRWIFHRDADQLVIDLLPGQAANIHSTSRWYDGYWDGRANGVAMEVVTTQGWIRLASSLTSQLSPITDAPPVVTRTDSASATLISSWYQNQTWDWMVTAGLMDDSSVGSYTLSGAAGCLRSNPGGMIGYCLFDGSNLAHGSEALIIADNPITVEASLQQGILVTEGVNITGLQLYWPNPVSSIRDENGNWVSYARDGNMIEVTIEPGRHTFRLQ